ncbi:MAG TPA: biopolymer transporter ExbD [Anaeromyxobacteraceae bacterium]|nr:biopolymer transporter ExbD [Anaeromyxobacteraceae bacterium]
MAAPPGTPPPAADPKVLARLKHERDFRRARRKARARAEEISELNITAMMDMMTIILVFLLKSYSASSLNLNLSDQLHIPQSTAQVQPQDNVNVTISLREVAVNDHPAVPVEGGLIPASAKESGKADSFYVGALHEALRREVEKQKYIARYNPTAPFSGRVNVIADRRIPYRTVMDVLYTAGQAELGEYKLMVMKAE